MNLEYSKTAACKLFFSFLKLKTNHTSNKHKIL